MKKLTIIGFFMVCGMGTLFHFLYSYVPLILFPRNESIFEHMKLVVFPFFLTFFMILPFYKEDGRALFSSFLTAILVSMSCIIIGYYTYSGFIGKNIDPINILLYYISIFIGFGFIYKKKTLISFSNSVIFSLILFIAILTFSFYVPNLSFFRG